MKRTIGMLLAGSLILSLAACGGNQSEQGAGGGSSNGNAGAGESINITIGGPQGETFSWIAAMEELYIPYVEDKLAETGNYTINWNRAWGGTICKYDETLEAVESGLLDIGTVCTTSEIAKLLLPNLTYYVPFNSNDIKAASDTWDQMREEFPEIDKEFEQYNQILLGTATIESYNMACKFEASGPADFNGKKVGASGPNLRWLDGTGAAGVTNPGTEAYSSLQTGVIDATMQHTGMLYTLQLFEQGPNILVGNFGGPTMMNITVNSDKWAALPEEVQNALSVAGAYYTEQMVQYSQDLYDTSLKEMENAGATIIYLSDEEREAWCNMLPNLPQEYAETLNEAGYDGTKLMTRYLELLEENGQPPIRDWMNE